MKHIRQLLRSTARNALLFVLIGLLASFSVSTLVPKAGNALAGNEFNPGFIISDSVFYNSFRLNQQQIQEWLNAQVPSCDTYGAKLSTRWNASQNRYYTRAEWGALNGNPAPYVCLKDYQTIIGAISADAYCNGLQGGHKTVSELIYEVARSCNVNPQALLVLLQKEQSLVTDDWPWARQYQAATGFACPDTASCNPAYAGLPNQLYYGARQYQIYKAKPDSFNYRAGRSQYILYNPNAACGGTNVYIQNQATAALYNYTPYQPNQAALNDLYGSGDGCSAFGNRNFWRIFNNWWGSPTADCTNDPTGNMVDRLYDPRTFNHYYSTNYCEINSLVKNVGYIYEGPAFGIVSGDTPGAIPIYRLYNNQTMLHFYTPSQADIDHATRYAGFHLEGIAYFTVPSSTPGAVPVYRLYNPKTFIHMWTPSLADVDQATRAAGYILEGPAFYTR